MASQQRLSQIRDLVTQWEQLIGYSIEVPDWAIDEMAAGLAQYESLYDVGQYMASHQRTGAGESRPGGVGAYFVPEWYAAMPWGQFGMTHTEYDTHIAAFNSTFRQLTGQDAPQDLIAQALSQSQGRISGPQFETWLLAQDSIKQTYGWLKYGLDFQQFQTQKLQMRQGFGRDLSDAEAVAQLQYHHAAQGRDMSAVAQPQRQQQKGSTAEVTGSVVR